MTWLVFAAVAAWAIVVGHWVWQRIDRRLVRGPERCEVCGVDLRRGWALHEQFADTGEGDPMICTAMSAFYCRRHRPTGAVRWPG